MSARTTREPRRRWEGSRGGWLSQVGSLTQETQSLLRMLGQTQQKPLGSKIAKGTWKREGWASDGLTSWPAAGVIYPEVCLEEVVLHTSLDAGRKGGREGIHRIAKSIPKRGWGWRL